ncbi:MAG: Bug family tripartite tricarboxylate transporter substrate binding protein [Rhodospirillaceae bacterium]
MRRFKTYDVWTAVLAAITVFCALSSSTAAAQTYPVKPIRIITPTGAGGSLDTMARVIAQKLAEAWGQQVIVDNRPGSGGMIGAGMAARSAPDGYTVLAASNGNLATTQALYKNVPYDPVKDFSPVVLTVSNPYVLVTHPSLPVKNTRELIRLAKTKPGAINGASSGNGSTPHLALALLNDMARIKITHVPYKTSPAGLASVVSGETSVMFTGVVSAIGLISANRVRALAVASDKRVPVLPDVPTVAEDGVPGYEASNWAGLLVPAGTPRSVIDSLNGSTLKILRMAEVQDVFRKQGLEPVGGTPEQFARFIKSEIVKWTQVVRSSGATID